MATALVEPQPATLTEAHASSRSAYVFAAAAVAIIVGACVLAGWAPLGFSIVTVFLFAGPHNWFEARYMLTRMPARWGPLTGYFTLGIGGVLVLTAAIAAIPWIATALQWSGDGWLAAIALWNTALISWIVVLVLLRSRQNPRRNWNLAIPIGLLLIGLNWLAPLGWSLVLVYLHPLMALWFLDRELRRMQPAWRATYRGCLLLVPLAIAALWWNLAAAADLPGDDWLSRQITRHAGAGILEGLSTHFLVSVHTFLEMLHYGVWVVAIPLVSVRMAPWRLDNVPLAKRSASWHWAVVLAVALGVLVMLVLWGGFVADYPLTRNIYFTVAMLHVLAEVPFLLRLL